MADNKGPKKKTFLFNLKLVAFRDKSENEILQSFLKNLANMKQSCWDPREHDREKPLKR